MKFKGLLRLAARTTRDEIFNSAYLLASRNTVCASIARAVWHNDARLARILLGRSEFARSHIDANSNSIQLINPAIYARDYDAASTGAQEQRRQEALRGFSMAGSSYIAHKIHRRKIACIERLLMLWSPFGKQLTTIAIKVNGSLIADDFEKQNALATAWAPTFSQVKTINTRLAEAVADRFASKFDLPDSAPPSSAFY